MLQAAKKKKKKKKDKNYQSEFHTVYNHNNKNFILFIKTVSVCINALQFNKNFEKTEIDKINGKPT